MASRVFQRPMEYRPGGVPGDREAELKASLGLCDEEEGSVDGIVFAAARSGTASTREGKSGGETSGSNGSPGAPDAGRVASLEAEVVHLQQRLAVQRSKAELLMSELKQLKAGREKGKQYQALAKALKQQVDWLVASSGLALPAELANVTMPTEADVDSQQDESTPASTRAVPNAAPTEEQIAEVRERVRKELMKQYRVKESYKRIQELEAELKTAHSAAGAQAASDEGSAMNRQLQEKEAAVSAKLKRLAEAYKEQQRELELASGRAKELQAELDEERNAGKKGAVPTDALRAAHAQAGKLQSEVRSLRAHVARATEEASRVARELVERAVPRIVAVKDRELEEMNAKYQKEVMQRRKLHNLVQELRGNIRVFCRVRPLLREEKVTCVQTIDSEEISIANAHTGAKKTLTFDKVFGSQSTQSEVFIEVQQLVVSMMDGFNVCVFAYGQTGSGKTHTMEGKPTSDDTMGIYWRTFHELFAVQRERSDWKYTLECAIVEIYNDEIKDLLIERTEGKPAKKLQVRQDNKGRVYVPDLTWQVVRTAEDVAGCLQKGSGNRSVGCTNMNEHSSRSHLIVSVRAQIETPTGKVMQSSMSLIDLAGSERLAKSGATGDRAKEAVHINKSLTALGDVINARATKSAHVPYRNSTLTNMLQDCLGGDSKTLMMLCVSPVEESYDESVSSLAFGARVNAVEMQVTKTR